MEFENYLNNEGEDPIISYKEMRKQMEDFELTEPNNNTKTDKKAKLPETSNIGSYNEDENPLISYEEMENEEMENL